MALIELKELQKYCKNKSIALVGNSSCILKTKRGLEIDKHDIIIRMNHSVSVLEYYKDYIGTRTDIYVCEVNGLNTTLNLIKLSKAKYVMKLIRWGNPAINLKERTIIKLTNNFFLGNPQIHKKFKETYFTETIKPSTGATIFNFLLEFIEFKNISLYGFDFFKSSNKISNYKNEFKSYKYKDHSSELEASFFKKFINNKNIKHIQ